MSMSRFTLPENFVDFTSAKMLEQPEPQYIFAQLFLAAVAAALPMPSGIGLDGRQVPNTGAAYPSASDGMLKLANGLPSSLFALGVDFSKKTGGTVRINRPAFPSTTYTLASRRLTTGATISTTPITVGMEQTSLTLERYAGPYGSAVQPYAIEAFDANMGIISEQAIIAANLAVDFHRFLDAVHVELANVGEALYPDGMTSDAGATSPGSFPMTVELITRTEQDMNEANLPTLPDGKRVMVLSPKQWKDLRHDPEYAANSAFHPHFNILFANYVGTVGAFHIFQSNQLQAPVNGSSVAVHRGIAFAPGGYMGGVGRKPRVAASTDDNYGETGKVVWIADLAFGIADDRYFRSVRSSA